MDLVDKLRQESSSEHVAYTEFILKLNKRKEYLFCFFEGKDDYKYYGIRVSNICQREFEAIDCGGKENVRGVKKLIEQKVEYSAVATSYFIDQDYENHSSIPNLYCLPSYSIENQYVTKSVLDKILKNEFSLDQEDKDYQRVIDLFENLQTKFHSKVRLINAWLACQSDKRKELKIKTYLKIDNAIGSYFSSIVNPDVRSLKDLNDLNNLDTINHLFPDAPEISEEELNIKINHFKHSKEQYTYRGKFELRFFISFLDRLKTEICKKNSLLFESKHKCNQRFEYSTSLTNLSIYAETPSCLIKYLDSKKINAA